MEHDFFFKQNMYELHYYSCITSLEQKWKAAVSSMHGILSVVCWEPAKTAHTASQVLINSPASVKVCADVDWAFYLRMINPTSTTITSPYDTERITEEPWVDLLSSENREWRSCPLAGYQCHSSFGWRFTQASKTALGNFTLYLRPNFLRLSIDLAYKKEFIENRKIFQWFWKDLCQWL